MIDAHVHVWDPAAGFGWLDGPLRRSYTLPDLQDEWDAADATEVSVILVEAGRGDDAETESLLRLAAGTPCVAGVVGAARLTDAGALDRLQALAESPNSLWWCGIRERLDRPGLADAVARVAGLLAGHGLVLEINVAPGRLHDAVDVGLAAGPGVPIVIDHVGTPPGSLTDTRSRQWAAALAEVAELPQVHLKLAGLTTQLDRLRPDQRDDLIRFGLELFGPRRAMLGSDWPVCTVNGGWRQAVESVVRVCSEYAPEARDWITGRTAERTYLTSRIRARAR